MATKEKSKGEKAKRAERFMSGGVPKMVRCYDDGGASGDRYTIVFTGRYRKQTAGEFVYIGASAHPFHPQGIGQHGGSPTQIDRPTSSHLGKRVKWQDLPSDVQKMAGDTYRELWDLTARKG